MSQPAPGLPLPLALIAMTESGRQIPHPGHLAAAQCASRAGAFPHAPRTDAPADGLDRAGELVGRVRDELDLPIPPPPEGDDGSADYSGTVLDDLAETAGRLERAHELLSDALAAVDKT